MRPYTSPTLGILLLPILMMLGNPSADAQRRDSFPKGDEAFLDEMRDFMMDADRREGKELIDDRFTPVWNGDSISPEQRRSVMEMSDLMLQNRLRAFPQFENYLLAVLSYVKAGRSQEEFRKWNELLAEMMKGRRKRQFNDFLEQSRHLFSEGVLYRSRSTEWKAEKGDYSFRIEDGEPIVRFPDLTLKCYAKGDSSVIYNTQGNYYPSEEEWIGKGGKITWERAGLDSSVTYALLKDYEIQVRSSRYDADSVRFFNSYFDEPLIGTIREQLLAGKSGKDARYPRFESYDQRLSIEELVENVDYEGGLTMQGARLSGSGKSDHPAFLHFKRKGERLVTLSSQNFSIGPDMINSDKVHCLIRIEDDSITHPSLRLKFDREERMMTLIREDEGLSKVPAYNTFHEVEMYFEALYWEIDDPMMELGNIRGSTQKKAAFESTDFFSEKRFRGLQGLSRSQKEHPLTKIKGMADKVDGEPFTAKELSSHMQLPFRQVNKLLLDFSTKGFVDYDPDEEEVRVRDKTYDYIKATRGAQDYDVLLFNSDISGQPRMSKEQNAQLSLLNYELKIRGVEQVVLSQTQNTVAYPKNGEVTVKENRNFDFNGTLRAGKMNLYGSEFNFEYDAFKVNVLGADSAHLRVRKLGKDEDAPVRTVRSTIENLKGEVRVSHPTNKSGYKDDEYHHFPEITNEKRSYVYYDDQEVQDGAYDREKFHFHMKSFVMDSLDDFNNEAMAFDGKFHSGGILPPFEEELTLQEDHSLGFVRDAPEGGFPVYGAGANFDNEIKLSNDGLQGNGNLSFMTANANSEEFTFFPDSTTGIAKEFVNEGQKGDPDVPNVTGEEVDVRYIPEEHVLTAEKRDRPMTIYQDVEMHGGVELGKDGMRGQGRMSFDKANLMSDDYELRNMTADADTADLDLATEGASDLAFSTHNVNAHLDFEKRMGEFKSNGEDSYIEFPENQYLCYMDQFNWYMDEEQMELEASDEMQQDVTIDTDLDLSGSNFYSTHPDQDSLNFMAPKAEYNIKEKVITAKEIPYIPVADARIAPNEGTITIRKDAEIDPLEDAEILANSVTKHHTIQEAKAEIHSKNDYEATGDRLYTDLNDMSTPIHFRDIGVDSTGETYGKGVVPKSEALNLSPHFTFYGDVELDASEEFLTFDGKVSLLHDCEDMERNFADFRSQIEPEDIAIPITDSALSNRDTAITSGVVLSERESELYSAFLSKKRDTGDIEVIDATGLLVFEQGDQEYRIANEEKLKQRNLPGDLVRLNNKSCQVSGEGRLDHGAELGQVELQPIGAIERDVEKDLYSFESSAILDFFFKEKAIEVMAEDILEFPKLDAVDPSKGQYEYAMREIIGVERTDELISDLTLKGEIEDFPEELEEKILLSNLDMKWDEESESFVSQGSIGIGSILEEQVFRYVDGVVQVKRMRSGDEIKIYFELDEKNWYYFEYKRGVMRAVSSNDEFNEIIQETKSSKRKYSGDGPDYRFETGTERKKIRFLRDLDR